MAGQAGLEPATTGFGVRRSSQLELLTPVSLLDFDLAMQGVAPASRTELLERDFFRGCFSVLGRRIIFPLAFVASKSDQFPHGRNLPSPALLGDFCDDTGAHGPAAFANGEV